MADERKSHNKLCSVRTMWCQTFVFIVCNISEHNSTFRFKIMDQIECLLTSSVFMLPGPQGSHWTLLPLHQAA